MSKRSKIVILSIVTFVLVISVAMIVLVPSKKSNTKKHIKKFKYEETDLIANNEYYNAELKYIHATLDDKEAYSLDYNSAYPCKSGGELKRLDSLTGITVAGLLYGYPCVSAQELNVENDNEARMATQFAIWRLAPIEGVDDDKTEEYIFDMRNIKPNDGYEECIERIKVAAQSIVDKATEKPYYANPKFNIIGDESKIVLINNEEMVVGPFLLSGKHYEINNVEVSLVDVPNSAILCDKKGNEKNRFKNNEEVYIKLPQDVGEIEFELQVDTEGVHYVAFAYGTGIDDDNKQNFCQLESIEDELDATMTVKLPDVSKEYKEKVVGKLKIVSIDENKEKTIAGIKYEILDENKQVIETLVSDSNGEILSKDLPAGKYYFREIDGPAKIHLDSTEREFNIVDNDVVEAYTVMHYYSRAKIKFGCTDTNGEKVVGATFEIYNKDGEVIDVVETDDNGIGTSKYLLLGEYYYKCISASDKVIIDEEKYDFSLSKTKQILECWIEFESK